MNPPRLVLRAPSVITEGPLLTVPDSHWTCQSDEFSDNGLVIFQAVQDASSPGDAEKFCNVYSIH